MYLLDKLVDLVLSMTLFRRGFVFHSLTVALGPDRPGNTPADSMASRYLIRNPHLIPQKLRENERVVLLFLGTPPEDDQAVAISRMMGGLVAGRISYPHRAVGENYFSVYVA